MRNEFHSKLSELHTEMMKMNTAIEKSLDMLISGMETRDTEILKEIVRRDDIVDDLEREIERVCINLISKEQPVAIDLRNLASLLKMITDLERISDHCTDIAKYLIEIIESSDRYMFDTSDFRNMSMIVKEMVSATTECYIKSDYKNAKVISLSDDKIDDYFDSIVSEIQEAMENDKNCIFQGIRFLYIAKYFERIADHTTNICEWIIYRVTGERKQYN